MKEPALRRVLSVCHYMRRFMPKQMLQRGVWDNIDPATRWTIIDCGYVKITENVVYLTLEGLSDMNYREHSE